MAEELWKYDEVGGLTTAEAKQIKKYPKGLTESKIKEIMEVK